MSSRLKRTLKELAINIIADFVAAVILYLILEEYVSEPLSQIFPFLPTLFVISLVFATVGGLVYRFYNSIKFHRFVETNAINIDSFITNWIKLNNSFHESLNAFRQANYDEKIDEFEELRMRLLYDYPKVSSPIRRFQRYYYVDRIRGIIDRNYDVIGNLLVRCPFTKLDSFNKERKAEEFLDSWDTGRTLLVYAIGVLDETRQGFMHSVYWKLKLIPRSLSSDSQINGQNEG